MQTLIREKPAPGQESVWDYPRPPAIRRCDKPVRIILDDEILAETTNAWCVLETSHPPTYYLPTVDIQMQWLLPTARSSYCEWKGTASYFDILKDAEHYRHVAWTYPQPAEKYAVLKGHVAFYPDLMDACFVGDTKVIPQPGKYYGGWITPDVVGPFKGEPGTDTW